MAPELSEMFAPLLAPCKTIAAGILFEVVFCERAAHARREISAQSQYQI
jgi:hypothetical protein